MFDGPSRAYESEVFVATGDALICPVDIEASAGGFQTGLQVTRFCRREFVSAAGRVRGVLELGRPLSASGSRWGNEVSPTSLREGE